ncbi:hypothetical protein VTL71DRAFT_5123 [Oculimacula yallundae]|uniref:Polymer-forming cytoskeletal protein n=1 Tax=Oculimacula yallundae TaxID=86028 RepID=A0ABR4C081_9HELO
MSVSALENGSMFDVETGGIAIREEDARLKTETEGKIKIEDAATSITDPVLGVMVSAGSAIEIEGPAADVDLVRLDGKALDTGSDMDSERSIEVEGTATEDSKLTFSKGLDVGRGVTVRTSVKVEKSAMLEGRIMLDNDALNVGGGKDDGTSVEIEGTITEGSIVTPTEGIDVDDRGRLDNDALDKGRDNDDRTSSEIEGTTTDDGRIKLVTGLDNGSDANVETSINPESVAREDGMARLSEALEVRNEAGKTGETVPIEDDSGTSRLDVKTDVKIAAEGEETDELDSKMGVDKISSEDKNTVSNSTDDVADTIEVDSAEIAVGLSLYQDELDDGKIGTRIEREFDAVLDADGEALCGEVKSSEDDIKLELEVEGNFDEDLTKSSRVDVPYCVSTYSTLPKLDSALLHPES